MLELKNLTTAYGKIVALSGLSLSVGEGEIVTVIGANGAGKTTALKTVAGLLRPQAGSVAFEGRDITRSPAHRIVRMGISLVPEGRRIFPELTVRENLEMGAYAQSQSAVKEELEKVFALFPILSERWKQPGGTLSGGEQQMLSIARALMSRPRLLLMDEPSLGLSPIMVETIFETITRINKQGAAILLVEQNANMALSIASRGYVIQSGRIAIEDTARALLRNESVRSAYLGIAE